MGGTRRIPPTLLFRPGVRDPRRDDGIRPRGHVGAVPNHVQVELDGFPAVYAMGAIDVLGIPAMAGRDGRIAATDPRDGAPVRNTSPR